MAATKNLCAQIPTDLHQHVCEAREQSGLTTAQYITNLLIEYYEMKKNGGKGVFMNKKHIDRLLSMLLAVAVMFGILAVPASAASLKDSGSVTIQQAGYGNYLSISTGGTVGGGYWKYTSNNGATGTAYCVNHGLKGVSPSKSLTVQEYNREPKTMGAFANGYPNRTLAQFKELHQDDVRGISGLTEDEYKYATQLAVWATCGQLAVPGTSFTAGREKFIAPTSDAQKIRIFDSVKAILNLANGWTKHIYTGMYLRAEENRDVHGVEVVHGRGLEGAAQANREGIKKETINGKEYSLLKFWSAIFPSVLITKIWLQKANFFEKIPRQVRSFLDKRKGSHPLPGIAAFCTAFVLVRLPHGIILLRMMEESYQTLFLLRS